MQRIPSHILESLGTQLSDHDRDEMAIPSYLHRNPLMRWMAWRRVEVVADRQQAFLRNRSKSDVRVLDFGCGSGVLFKESASWASVVFGSDIVLGAAEKLLEIYDIPEVQLVHADEIEGSIPEHSLDLAIAAEVLEHVDSPGDTATRLGRLLRPDGRLLVSLPTENALYRLGRRLAGFEGHYHHSNAASIHEDIRAAGFEVVSTRSIPAPGPLAIYMVAEYSPPRS